MRFPRRARRAGCAAALGVAVLLHAGIAWASFTKTTAAVSPTISTGSLSAPTGLSAARGTCTPISGPAKVNVSWTATASTWADGYEIFRGTVNGGPYTSQATVSGRTTVTWTDSNTAFSTTYYYVVKAKKNSWRSNASNQASVTTPSTACV